MGGGSDADEMQQTVTKKESFKERTWYFDGVDNRTAGETVHGQG